MAARKISRGTDMTSKAKRLREALGPAKGVADNDPLKRRSEELNDLLRESRAMSLGLVETIN